MLPNQNVFKGREREPLVPVSQKDALTQTEWEGGNTGKRRALDLSLMELSPASPSSLPVLLALDQYTSQPWSSTSLAWLGCWATAKMLCFDTWWALWMMVCYPVCLCTHFPSHGFCGQNPQQACSMRKQARGGRIFQMKQWHSRRSCRDQNGKEGMLLAIPYTAHPPPPATSRKSCS